MRLHCIITVIAAVAVAGCATRRAVHVEVTPTLLWHPFDDRGRIGPAYYDCVTNGWVTNRYAPFVVCQGVPCTMDFSDGCDSFWSPDTQRDELYFDGLIARLSVAVSNTTVSFWGRTEYQIHLGATASDSGAHEAVDVEAQRSHSTRFRGRCALAHAVQVGAGDDLNDEPVLCLVFRLTTAPLSDFDPDPLEDTLAGSEYSPEARAAWQKYCRVKKGMTYSQVYGILPSSGRYPAGHSQQAESWHQGNMYEDNVSMAVIYGANGRVMQVDRRIQHGAPVDTSSRLVR